MDRQAFRNRMQLLKLYRELNPGKTYLDFKDERTDHPAQLRIDLDHNIDIAQYTDLINHTDKNGEYNPFYLASDDTYGTVELPTVLITAPLTDQARRNIEARRGASYVDEGRRKAAPYVGAIVAGAALPAMASTGGLGTAIDIASTISNPTDPLNYIDKFKLWRALRIDKNSDHIVRALINKRQFKDLSTFGKDSDKYIHIDLGNKSSLFSGKGKGAYIKDNKLYPGESILPDLDSYVWWNKNKPYSDIGFNTDGHTTTIIDPDIAEDLLLVRMSNKPIGQWNGNNGFVLKSEYVTNKPVPLKHAQQYKYNGLIGTFENIKYFADGGEIPPNNKPIIPEEPQPYKGKLYKDRYGRKYTEDQMNEYYDSSTDEIDRFTGKPFIRGLKPVGDIEDAANATPVGDAISAYDTYKALKNKDWGNAGLAALGLVPFVPSFGGVAVRSSKKISKPKSTYVPKVDPNYKLNVIDKALHEQKSYSDMPLSLVEEINDQRNRTYDLMQEPYARERAKAVDHQYGTDYLKVYDSMLEKYVDIDEYFQLPKPKYKKMERPTIGAQVTPSEGNTMYFNRDMIKTPEDIPNSVVLHEMGHLVDGAAGMNNEFLRKLGDKSKFIPFNQAKTMYPNMTRDMYDNILLGTEIKSYMNQFRNYLDQKGKLNRGNYTGSYKNLKKEIIDAPKESFNNIKAIFNLYRSPKLFNKDFQMIPIVNNTNDNTIA